MITHLRAQIKLIDDRPYGRTKETEPAALKGGRAKGFSVIERRGIEHREIEHRETI